VFSHEELFNFIFSAPNDGVFLVMKLVILFCYYSALRMSECVKILRSDVTQTSTGILAKIIRKKTDKAGLGQTFVIPNIPDAKYNPVDLYKDYMYQTQRNTHARLWLTRDLKSGYFKNAPIGKNTIAKYPRMVAEFLGLENPSSYTGHSLRATSATILADAGVSMENLKRHGQWKSSSVVEGYIHDSMKQKIDMATSLTSNSTNTSSTASTASTATNVGTIFINCIFEGSVQYTPPSYL
jgi:integrase